MTGKHRSLLSRGTPFLSRDSSFSENLTHLAIRFCPRYLRGFVTITLTGR